MLGAKKKNRITEVIVLTLLGLLVAGGAVSAEDELTDIEIANAVDKELIDDSATPAYDIDVSAKEGIVTLKGTVTNIMARDRAKALAETVRGVRGVVNRLAVAAPLRSDKEIREDVEQALRHDPATENWEVDVTVEDGAVTLSGVVDSMQEKELSGKVAKGVIGVKDLENELSIKYMSDRPDKEIQQEIKKVFRWDALIDDALIEVAVMENKVKLTGTVGSAAEKARAWRKAWVDGVELVDVSELGVKWWTRDEKLRKDKYVSKSGAQIEAAVLDALRYDPRVDSQKIDVSVEEGLATLRGTVGDLKQKRIAARDARNVLGVWAVRNDIKVQMDSPPSDSKIKSMLKSALVRDPIVEEYEILAKVKDGEVYLYGDVNSILEKAQADDVAARQEGVKAVHNFLTVHERYSAPYDPYVDDWALYDYDWYTNRADFTAKTDWEIEREIKDELFWSPFVDSDQVNVEVDDGVAELTGTVDTWSERTAAAENALEGGALSVDNDLAVVYGPEYYKP